MATPVSRAAWGARTSMRAGRVAGGLATRGLSTSTPVRADTPRKGPPQGPATGSVPKDPESDPKKAGDGFFGVSDLLSMGGTCADGRFCHSSVSCCPVVLLSCYPAVHHRPPYYRRCFTVPKQPKPKVSSHRRKANIPNSSVGENTCMKRSLMPLSHRNEMPISLQQRNTTPPWLKEVWILKG